MREYSKMSAPPQSEGRLMAKVVSDDLATYSVKHSSVAHKALNILALGGVIVWILLQGDFIHDMLLGVKSRGMNYKDWAYCLGTLAILAGVYLFIKGSLIETEGVTFMRGVGVELSKVSVSGKVSVRFVPITHCRELIMYEHVGTCKVTNVFGIVAFGVDHILIPFSVEMKLDELVKVYKSGKKVLGI